MNLNTIESNRVPSLQELMAGYIRSCEEGDDFGLSQDEITPHDSTVSFRSSPVVAWNDCSEVASFYSWTLAKKEAPKEWNRFVYQQAPIHALPMAFGNYPQSVRDIGFLNQLSDLSKALLEQESTPVSTPMKDWATREVDAIRGNAKSVPQALLAVGVIRAMGDCRFAEELLLLVRKSSPESSKVMVENEQASLFWQQGKAEAALAIWEEMPESIFSTFNRGMACLFLNRFAEAAQFLTKSIAMIPASSNWYHLAQIYLVLASGNLEV